MFVFFTLLLVEFCHSDGKNLNHLSVYVTMPLNIDIAISFIFVKLLRKVMNKFSAPGKLIMCKHILIFS